MKTRTFEKERQTFQWKKLFVRIFSYYRAIKNSGNTLQRSMRYSEIYCGIYRRIFFGPERLLKTQNFESKGKFSSEEKNLAFISPYYRTWQRSENIFRGPRALLSITVELIRAFSSDLRGCWKHNFWRKRQPFQWKQNYWPVLTRIIVYDKAQRTIHKGPQAILTNTVWIIGFFLRPTRLLKTRTSEKKRQPFQWKKLFDQLFPYYRAKKTQETLYEGP